MHYTELNLKQNRSKDIWIADEKILKSRYFCTALSVSNINKAMFHSSTDTYSNMILGVFYEAI